MTMRTEARDSPNANRRVSSLTPQQVEKKRAIDRENQRHCRAKTKSRIKALEEKVAELTGQLRAAEAQIACYQEREQASCSEASSNDAGNALTIASHSRVERHHSWPSKDVVSLPATSSYEVSGPYLDAQSPQPFSYSLDFAPGITLNALSGSHDELDFLGLGLAGEVDLSTPSTAPMSALPLTAPASPWAAAANANQYGDAQPWQTVPINIAPTSKLDEVIIETTTAWRARAGHRDAELSEPVFPSISSLLNPESSPDTENEAPNQFALSTKSRILRPLSNVVAAQTYRTPLKTLPERLAFMYILSHLLRWLVCRTKESYYAMPEYLRPTELQRTVPHPAWIDTIIWPQLRDHMICHMDWGRFQELRRLAGGSLSVNWPFAGIDAFVETPDKQSLVLSPVFEAHLRRRENWTMGREVAEAFPFLKPYTREG